jgi:hypothetical protein
MEIMMNEVIDMYLKSRVDCTNDFEKLTSNGYSICTLERDKNGCIAGYISIGGYDVYTVFDSSGKLKFGRKTIGDLISKVEII